MTVKKLIEELKAMPPDVEVMHLWDGEPRTTIEHVWLARGGFVVTSDDGMVCYSENSRPEGAPTKKEDNFWMK